MKAFFASIGITPGSQPAADASIPLLEPLSDEDDEDADEKQAKAGGETTGPGGGERGESRILSGLPVKRKVKLAFKGTKEQRAQLIRDPNKLVAAAVLSSPKLTESEVESFAKMANVSEEVLRVIGMNRSWLKNYGVILGLVKNPKTPPALSMQLLPRITERDMKMVADRPQRAGSRPAGGPQVHREGPQVARFARFFQSFRISARPSMKTVAR